MPRSGDASIICAEDRFEAVLKRDRTVVSIEAEPARPALSRLVGQRGGAGLRQALAEIIPDERAQATPLYLILDDIAGASLVSNWAWSQWNPQWLEVARAAMNETDFAKAMASRVGVCIGFAPGSSVFDPDRERGRGAPAAELCNPDDPGGWHEFPVLEGISMRRARRIDVRVSDVIVIDAAFQDSATTPAGGRAAVHEYSLTVTADPVSLKVLSVEAGPMSCRMRNVRRRRGTSRGCWIRLCRSFAKRCWPNCAERRAAPI